VLFLLAGFFCGPGMLGYIELQPRDPVGAAARGAGAFSILFTDGMRVNLCDLTTKWRLPLTLLGTAALRHSSTEVLFARWFGRKWAI